MFEVAASDDTKAKPAVQAWTPSYKYKVLDKELEFDEQLKKATTSKEVEDKLKELYEKASGLDEIKTKRQQAQSERDEWRTKYTSVETSLKTLGEHVRKKDFGSFFEALQIPKEDIFKFVADELKYEALPAEQKNAIEQRRQLEQQYAQQSQYSQTLEQQMAQLVANQAATELNFELSKPGLSQIIESFDAREGKPGAFRNEVIRRGQYYEKVLGQYASPSQVVQELVKLIGAQVTTQPGTNQTPGLQTSQSQAQDQAEKPVITSFGGAAGAKSPVRRVATSMEDLRKIKAERDAQLS